MLDEKIFIERLKKLCNYLTLHHLDGVMVPRSDEHFNIFISSHAERLAWLTNFNGSAGLALILKDQAFLFVDGRYVLSSKAQVPRHISVFPTKNLPVVTWLKENLKPGQRIGYDPWLHSHRQILKFQEVFKAAEAQLVPLAENPIDKLWEDQPPAALTQVTIHGINYAGRSIEEKINLVKERLRQDKAKACVLTSCDSIAWLLNIRGNDNPWTPLPYCFCIFTTDAEIDLFIDPRKVSAAVTAYLGSHIRLHAPDKFKDRLRALIQLNGRVVINYHFTPHWVANELLEAGVPFFDGDDPCEILKASKTPQELEGARAAHIRDGAALTTFLAWLDKKTSSPFQEIPTTEIEAAQHLDTLRSKQPLFNSLSFPTVSAAGPHSANIHHAATPETNRPVIDCIYLVDSGGQYHDGTTDVTRTVAIGSPTLEQCERFTRVLKGHIALARARFPKGTTGGHLDIVARMPLWQSGLDYEHGTGHGVGSYLSVHEGPQFISSRAPGPPLEAGMILSNEPGYYKEGQYGIRIENLVAVKEASPLEEGEREMLEFETLTLAPLDRHLIKVDMLNREEIDWVDSYHRRVYELLKNKVDFETRLWLQKATEPLRGG